VQSLDDGGLELVPAAHRLLGLSTLLINLAEHAAQTAKDGADSRDRTLTGSDLPRCFRRGGHTATMFEFDCDCEFRLCGRGAKGQVGRRRFSRAFAKRAEAICSAPRANRARLFTTQAFQEVWRDLDAQLVAELAGEARD